MWHPNTVENYVAIFLKCKKFQFSTEDEWQMPPSPSLRPLAWSNGIFFPGSLLTHLKVEPAGPMGVP